MGDTPETTIAPAMTPEQWRWFGEYDTWTFINSACEPGHSRAPEVAGDKLDHALAALALHGQPFGFTRDGLAELERAVSLVEGVLGEGPNEVARRELAKIAALLPPEG